MTCDAYWKTDFTLSLDDRIRAYKASITADPTYTGFDTALLREIEYISSDPSTQTILYGFRVSDFMCNKDGNLHGGAVSTIFDNLSSTALYTISKPGFWDEFGVSRSLSVWYHRPLARGMIVRLRCRVVAAGRRMGDCSGGDGECGWEGVC